jgi:transposase
VAKYSFEFKKKVVDMYNAGAGGYSFIANHFNVPRSMVFKWVAAYNQFGTKDYYVQEKMKLTLLNINFMW